MKYFSGSMVIFLHFLFLWVCIYSILCIWSGDPALEIFGILFFWGIFLKIFANFIWQYWKQKNCFEFREDENTNLLPASCLHILCSCQIRENQKLKKIIFLSFQFQFSITIRILKLPLFSASSFVTAYLSTCFTNRF